MTSIVVCNAFLQKCPSPKKEALLNAMPSAERQKFEALPKTLGDPTQGFLSIEKRLAQIHTSWFAPFLRTLPEREIRLFLSALSESQVDDLKQLLRFAGDLTRLKKAAKQYLQTTLHQKLTENEDDLLPIECLPSSPFSSLLNLKLSDLNALIDYLGMHDLAVEVRRIIEKTRLKKIEQSLSEQEKNYLKILLQSQEPVVFPPMGIANWQGDVESLRTLINQRGVNRLAKALYGEHPSFIWHLTHKMHVDLGTLFQKLYAPLESASATKVLNSQVLELLSYMGHSK
jgi:hypothetical protein